MLRASLLVFPLILQILPPAASAVTIQQMPAKWVELVGTGESTSGQIEPPTPKSAFALTKPTNFQIKYTNFPDQAKTTFDAAVSVWASLYESNVPITIDATWINLGRTVLGSARPGSYFSGFSGAPDKDLYYPSALANALAGKDLDEKNPEIVARFSSASPWYFGTDGKVPAGRYDFMTAVIHELCHGLGFLSTDEYDVFSGQGGWGQFGPTAFDAYLRNDLDQRLADFLDPNDLGKNLTKNLYWAGSLGTAANGGKRPKMYTPNPYDDGSSISHMDENTFAYATGNALMSPQLDFGETIHDPGPVVLGMMDDLRIKPTTGLVASLPNPPTNPTILVGDKSAIISFKPAIDWRLNQVTGYSVTVTPGNSVVTANSTPITVTGLKPGLDYTFAIRAINDLGKSQPLTTSAITAQQGWKSSVLDASAEPSFVSTVTWRGSTVIIYNDVKSGVLKQATLIKNKWINNVIDGEMTTNGRTTHRLDGALSACVTGPIKNQILHIFYSDMVDFDLRHAQYDGKKWSFDIVDGNGTSEQEVEDPIRRRVSSKVNIGNACVATSEGLEVFYRDDTKGILLGAVQKGRDWAYELVDGDRKSDGRTIGDVGFHMAATNVGKSIHLVYDSVLAIDRDPKRNPTQGDVRHAHKNGLNQDWYYETVDAADARYPVAGYNVAIGVAANRVYATWLAASSKGALTPIQDGIFYGELNGSGLINSLTTGNLGTPSSPLAVDGSDIAFGCQDRICKATYSTGSVSFVSSESVSNISRAQWLTINKKKGLLTGSSRGLIWLSP